MIARTHSAYHHGITGEVVRIEAASQFGGDAKIRVTGLPTEVVKESTERVRVALSQLGFDLPTHRIVVHLSPANTKKEGSQFDLPIALSILAAEACLPKKDLSAYAFVGELGLDGCVRSVKNIIPLLMSLEAREEVKTVLVPAANGREASLVGGAKLRLVNSLADAFEWLHGRRELPSPPARHVASTMSGALPSIDDVIGHPLAKRALEIALAGRHHLLFVGSPGVGKTMLAQAAASLLPPLFDAELLELAMIHFAADERWNPAMARPFRSPHHSVSSQGFVGGGTGRIVPGELSLAHHGILFLDEFPEFRRDVIEGLREPLQSGEIHLHRLGHSFRLPARFFLITAMNPCPCGFVVSPARRCTCPREKIFAYRKRISGAIVDRLDLGVVMEKAPTRSQGPGVKGETIRARIEAAWNRQFERYGPCVWNGDKLVTSKEPAFELGASANELMDSSRFASLRSEHKLIRISRTIADLEGDETIEAKHIQEAWALRCPDLHSLASG